MHFYGAWMRCTSGAALRSSTSFVMCWMTPCGTSLVFTLRQLGGCTNSRRVYQKLFAEHHYLKGMGPCESMSICMVPKIVWSCPKRRRRKLNSLLD